MSDNDYWLDAWNDPVSNLHALSDTLCLADDYIYVGDLSGVLSAIGPDGKVTNKIKLVCAPSAVCQYWGEVGSPLVAVACHSTVYIFRNMEPFSKFTVPPQEMLPVEKDTWKQAETKNIGAQDMCAVFKSFQTQKGLSQRSLDLLALEHDPDRLQTYVERECSSGDSARPIPTSITCMKVLRKSNSGGTLLPSVGLLVLGTESNKLIILDSISRKINHTITLPSIPVFISIEGTLDSEYRIVVACRNNRLYSIKDGNLVRRPIELEAPICGGVVRSGKDIIVATTEKRIYSYHVKGKRNWTLLMPSEITNIAPFSSEKSENTGFLVSLRNHEIRLYIGKSLMSTTQIGNQIVAAMQFGSFNREANSLVLLDTSGSLSIKMLRRKANLNPSIGVHAGPPPEQDVPINIPKKTKLYIDQTQRERDHAVEMHSKFQYDLCKTRVVAAAAYLKLFADSGSANAQMCTSANHYIKSEDIIERLHMSAEVVGLGPLFKMVVRIENTGPIPIFGATAILACRGDEYLSLDSLLVLPALLPQIPSVHSVRIRALKQVVRPTPVEVLIIRKGETLIAASIEMPSVESME